MEEWVIKPHSHKMVHGLQGPPINQQLTLTTWKPKGLLLDNTLTCKLNKIRCQYTRFGAPCKLLVLCLTWKRPKTAGQPRCWDATLNRLKGIFFVLLLQIHLKSDKLTPSCLRFSLSSMKKTMKKTKGRGVPMNPKWKRGEEKQTFFFQKQRKAWVASQEALV